MTSSVSKATSAVRASIESDTQHGAVVPPMHLSSNYTFAGFGEPRQYDYTRSGNPNFRNLEDVFYPPKSVVVSFPSGGAGGHQ